MFFTYCKDTGCVLIKSSEHPSKVFNLIPDFNNHFSILDLNVDHKKYLDKIVKIENGAPVIIGPMNEENMKLLCGDCPNPFSSIS